MNLQPTEGKLIVKVAKEEEKTAGGLYIPGSAIAEGNLATVVAAYQGEYFDAQGIRRFVDMQVGQTVVIGRYAGVRIEHEGETYVVLKRDEVLAVVLPSTSNKYENNVFSPLADPSVILVG